MKAFLRGMAGFLLCAMLSTFCMWRNQAFPDLSAVTAFLQDTAAHVNDAVAMIEGAAGNAGNRPVDPTGSFPTYDISAPLDPALESYLCTALSDMETDISVSAYHLTNAEIGAVMNAIHYAHPEFFYVDGNYYLTTVPGVDQVISVRPVYLYDAATVSEMRLFYEATLADIAAGVPAGATDFDKVLYLHDYFVKNYTYDYTYTIRDAYTFFEKKTGVCQAYMLAMIAAAETVGVRSLPVTSTEMLHAWNLVEVGGAWYHVDVTWDDSASLPTMTSYRYFLLSDAGLAAIDAGKSEPHRDWSASSAADSALFDGVVWRHTNAPMLKRDGVYYCVAQTRTGKKYVHGAVYHGTDVTALEPFFDVTAEWQTAGGCYVDCYAGLAFFGDDLVYSTANSLRLQHLPSGENTQIALFSLEGAIYGIDRVNGTEIVFLTAASPDAATYELHAYTPE